ncbi:hypothetical protein Tco_0139756 [Tanacetum coccineum]
MEAIRMINLMVPHDDELKKNLEWNNIEKNNMMKNVLTRCPTASCLNRCIMSVVLFAIIKYGEIAGNGSIWSNDGSSDGSDYASDAGE